MKFNELIKKVSEELGLTQVTTKAVTEKIFDIIKSETFDNQVKVRVPSFGTFKGKTLPAKKGKCNGKEYDVPERKTIKFSIAKDVKNNG